jgi:catechol 2,3-dioxygenase-like lactoylglutathione lyase family enzyme
VINNKVEDMKLDHVAINVKNLQKSIDWYLKNLNAIVEYCDDSWAMLSIGNTKVALTLELQHPPHIAFKVKDFGKELSNVRLHRDNSRYVYISDPDGNTIELIQYAD